MGVQQSKEQRLLEHKQKMQRSVNEIDINIHRMKKELNTMERNIIRAARSGDRSEVKRLNRRKATLNREIAKAENACNNISALKYRSEEAYNNAVIQEAITESTDIVKEITNNNDINTIKENSRNFSKQKNLMRKQNMAMETAMSSMEDDDDLGEDWDSEDEDEAVDRLIEQAKVFHGNKLPKIYEDETVDEADETDVQQYIDF